MIKLCEAHGLDILDQIKATGRYVPGMRTEVVCLDEDFDRWPKTGCIFCEWGFDYSVTPNRYRATDVVLTVWTKPTANHESDILGVIR